MNLSVETFLDQQKHPLNKLIFPVSLHHTFLDAAFLQDGQAKSLSDASIVLFFQNLDRSIITFIILSRTAVSLPPVVRYSIPLRVDTMTEMREVTACLKLLFLLLSIVIKKLKLSFWVILNISLRISSSTRFFLSSGAICRALTLRDKRI